MNKKPAYNIKTQIRSALRRVWLYSHLRRDALSAARISRGVYRCPKCSKLNGPKLMDVDHIVKATPAGGLNTPDDYGVFIGNLLFCGPEGVLAICKPCHAIKTKEERSETTHKKKAKKRKKKKTPKRIRISRT